MKIKCINNDGWPDYLTIGKTYEVIRIYKNTYRIIDDDGDECGYHESYFKPLSKIRNEKIDKLLE